MPGGRLLGDRRRAAFLTGATALGIDIVITSIDFLTGELEEGRGPILDTWDLLKVLAVASVLGYAGWKARSRGLGLFAGIFAIIGIADHSFAHDRVAEWLVDRIDLRGLGELIPGDSAAWVELIILTGFAAGVATLIWTVVDTWEGFDAVRRSLTALLVVLVIFAIGVDLIAASSSFTGIATLVEETGERFTLSVILGYVTGIALSVRSGPQRGS